MAKKVQLQTNGKEWRDGQYVDVEKRDIDPITSSSCVQIEGFRTLEEAVSDNKMLSQDLTYTKVMDKVGGDYHQNVLDGQYSKAILYGNTQVNLCEEDTSVALQIPTTFTSFNNGELQINNKENQVVAPLIKGVTMVNLAQTNSASLASSESVTIENVKGNTLYTLSFKFTTKNTNSGVTIESYNGDTYLENTMHKTGLGDVAKFTFTTHTNATVVKVVNNAAYGGQTIQLDEIMLIEGDQTALDVPFFKGMKSVELVRPLTNLFNNDLEHYDANVTSTNSNGTVTVTASSNNSWANVHYNLTNLKANTNYLVMWDSISTTQTATTNTDILICMVQASNNGNLGRMDNNSLNPTKRCIMFNTANIPLTDIVLRVHATLGNTETGKTTVTGLRVFEYDDYLRSVDLQSIGWFSGTKNVAVEPIKTCSKNLYPYGDVSFTPTSAGWFDAKGNGNMYGDIAQKSKSRFLLKKGTYYLSMGEGTNISSVQLINDKEEMLPYTPLVLEQDTYLTIRVNASQANVATTLTNIQIERGETATDYIAHDSRYYEPNGQNAIVLRSLPGGVCDTFNLQTGEYVQRIGEVILNGSETWAIGALKSNTMVFYTTNTNPYAKRFTDVNLGGVALCAKFSHSALDLGHSSLDIEGIYTAFDGNLCISINKSKLSTQDMNGFKQYLQQNPITVQYELATPVTTIIPRTVKRNNNGTVSTIDFGTYTNKESLTLPKNPTFLTINSMTSIKPVVEPITYFDFKTRLKGNTDYSIKLDKIADAQLAFKIGGVGSKGTYFTMNSTEKQKIVKTPTLDVSNILRISGSGSIQNIMVIEGDVLDKELPYFNGMCNVKMPIVRNCGKNLFDINDDNFELGYIDESGNIVLKNRSSNFIKLNNGFSVKVDSMYGGVVSPFIKVKPNTSYKFSYEQVGSFASQNHFAFYNSEKKIINFIEEKNLGYQLVTPNSCEYIRIGFWLFSPGVIQYKNIQLEQGIASTSFEPYRGNDICIAQGEIGLSQDMFEQGTTAQYTANIGKTYQWMKENSTSSWNVRRLRIKSLIKVEPNTKLILQNRDNFMYAMGGYGADKLSLGTFDTGWIQNTIITIPQDVHYISYVIRKKDDTNITINDFNQTNFALLKPDKTIALRSLPNGVKDELNLLTGEYIQRVGEIVLDGNSENWVVGSYTEIPFHIQGELPNNCIDEIDSTKILSSYNKQVFQNSSYGSVSATFYYRIRGIVFCPPEGITTREQAIEYIQANPITVQYELAEPIISYPRIVSNTQEREVGVKLPNGVCDTYNPSTGITVKRVGFIEFNGNEDWHEPFVAPTSGAVDMYNIWTERPLINAKPAPANEIIPGVCDKLNFKNSTLGSTNEEFYYISSTGRFNMNLRRSKLSEPTEQALKTYLSQNPIKLWYELKNPIVTTDIVLPNGVHDDYNPITGLYTKRVGMIEFDGSDDENWVSGSRTTATFFDGWNAIIPNIKTSGYSSEFIVDNSWLIAILCNNIEVKAAFAEEHICVSLNNRERKVSLGLTNSKLATCDLATFKTYLSQNPVKVWYELDTPITYQLTPYFGLPIPYAYKDGYLIMDSAYDGQTLPPEITYQLTVNRTGQITQNNIKLKEHTARLSNLEYILIEATLDSIFSREMQNFELELMNVELFNLDE